VRPVLVGNKKRNLVVGKGPWMAGRETNQKKLSKGYISEGVKGTPRRKR